MLHSRVHGRGMLSLRYAVRLIRFLRIGVQVLHSGVALTGFDAIFSYDCVVFSFHTVMDETEFYLHGL